MEILIVAMTFGLVFFTGRWLVIKADTFRKGQEEYRVRQEEEELYGMPEGSILPEEPKKFFSLSFKNGTCTSRR